MGRFLEKKNRRLRMSPFFTTEYTLFPICTPGAICHSNETGSALCQRQHYLSWHSSPKFVFAVLQACIAFG